MQKRSSQVALTMAGILSLSASPGCAASIGFSMQGGQPLPGANITVTGTNAAGKTPVGSMSIFGAPQPGYYAVTGEFDFDTAAGTWEVQGVIPLLNLGGVLLSGTITSFDIPVEDSTDITVELSGASTGGTLLTAYKLNGGLAGGTVQGTFPGPGNLPPFYYPGSMGLSSSNSDMPEPGSLLLFGGGIFATGWLAWGKRGSRH